MGHRVNSLGCGSKIPGTPKKRVGRPVGPSFAVFLGVFSNFFNQKPGLVKGKHGLSHLWSPLELASF